MMPPLILMAACEVDNPIKVLERIKKIKNLNSFTNYVLLF